ncbi:DUF4355 domain-containing protein [Bacillus litorisediminis]|uniref:DUF4355 domain-containing protein n=1 Tax=Bacillus litorisediminis TaxID=2922713 RepID=UPI001FAF5CFD|nr:DUF4355 domain-containing protein [Bacillus litorisediminis]
MELNLEQVQQFFESNKDNTDVKDYLGKLSTPTVEGVKGFLESNEEGKKLFQSLSDAKVTQGIETFKKNNLQKLLDEEIKKRFPEKDPKDIELENIKAELAKIQAEKARESLTNKAIKIANEQKLPLDLVDYFIGDDEEKTTANLTKLKEVFDTYIQSAVDEKLKADGTSIKEGKPSNEITKEQFDKLGYSERAKLANENPELYKKLSR